MTEAFNVMDSFKTALQCGNIYQTTNMIKSGRHEPQHKEIQHQLIDIQHNNK